MKEYTRYIFDLDYTLLIPDWSLEDEFFKKVIPKEQHERFFKMKQDILDEYERKAPRYDFQTLSDFFKSYGFTLSAEAIEEWMAYNGENIIDEVVDGVIELFEYLKEHNKEIVILTCWFSGTQRRRLERTGLLDYVDKIVGGEDAMKPSPESFRLAIGDTPLDECCMIGDSASKDGDGARRVGITPYIVNKEFTMRDLANQIMDSNHLGKR